MGSTSSQTPVAAKQNVAADTLPRRPWYRLHRSTVILSLPLLAAFVILIVAGEIESLPMIQGPQLLHIEHGWPWPYLENDLLAPANYVRFDPHWLGLSAWILTGDVKFISIWAFTGDLAIAAAILFLAAVMLEWRRRGRAHFSHFTIIEVVLGLPLIVVSFTYWKATETELRADEELLTKCQIGGFPETIFAPVWPHKLFGTQIAKHCELREYRELQLSRDEIDCLGIANRLQRLKSIVLKYPSNIDQLPVWINLHPRIKHVRVQVDADEATVESLQRIPKLDSLRVFAMGPTLALLMDVHKLNRLSELQIITRTPPRQVRMLAEMRCLPIVPAGIQSLGISVAMEGVLLRPLVHPGDYLMSSIARLPHLRKLELSDLSPTDAGLDYISSLTRLTEFGLEGAQGVTDLGLARLANLSKLEALSLGEVRITAGGISELGALKNLSRLRIASCQGFDDAVVKEVAKLSQLEELVLFNVPITDACVADLMRMTRLRVLQIGPRGRMLSKSAIDRLKKAMPKCSVHQWP